MDTLAIIVVTRKARLVCERSMCICNKYSRQIHTVSTSTLEMDFSKEFKRTDRTGGRRYEFTPVKRQSLNELGRFLFI